MKIEPKQAVTSDPDGAVRRGLTQSVEEQVSALAYQLWCERGCPPNSDQEDWFRAEKELKDRLTSGAAA
jgi:hypothetical protein